jgi:molecular chaperone DnaK
LRAPRVPAEARTPRVEAELPPPSFEESSFGGLDQPSSDLPVDEPPAPIDTAPERPSRRISSTPPSALPEAEVAPEVRAPSSQRATASGRKSKQPRTPGSVSVPAPPLGERSVPLLLDVTPHTLAVETTGGYCEQIIGRNAPIPTEQTRRFSTSQDNQAVVRVRVCQGEERRVEANQELGAVELLGLRRAARGQVKIDVTFMVDVNGTLDVRARDESTGKEQEIRIDLVGALTEDDVERMRKRQAELGWG